MTIKDLKEILMHYQDRKYNDWEIKLWDYNNQREVNFLEGTHASSNETKSITFPVMIDPVDGEDIDERLKRLISEMGKNI